MKLSLKIKLHTDTDQKEALLKTMLAYNSACNFVSEFAFKQKVFNNFSLHTALYQKIRADYKLPAQLAVSVFSKVADAYKPELTKAAKEQRELAVCQFREHSAVVYDSRILSYGKDNNVSIKTLEKRLKLPASLYKEERIPYFQGEADLLFVEGVFYLSQTLSLPNAPKAAIEDYLGVDLGIVQIATDSDGESFSGEALKVKREQYQKHQRHLQKCHTKNSRRRHRKVGKRESRFRKDVNHCISKHLVEKAKRTSQGIALEDLEQFFDKTRVRRQNRNERGSWSFRQLRDFISYKATLEGIPVVFVSPAHTSRRCFQCGHIDKANRKSQSEFVCVACGHTDNADNNAAKNIRHWAAVNQPIAVKDSASPQALAGGS